MDRRAFLKSAVVAAGLWALGDVGTGEATDMALDKVFPRFPLPPVGTKLLKAPADATGQSANPKGDMWTVAVDPTGVNRKVIANLHRPGLPDGHATFDFGRDMAEAPGFGSTTYRVFEWCFMPGEFEQTARNLIWQTQEEDSPIAAISTERKTDRYSLVERVGGDETRHDLGPIPWGHWPVWVIGEKLADSGGWLDLWYSASGTIPDVFVKPLIHLEGDTWQNGRKGHDTLGMYALHASKTEKPYLGYFHRYGRAATALGAINNFLRAA